MGYTATRYYSRFGSRSTAPWIFLDAPTRDTQPLPRREWRDNGRRIADGYVRDGASDGNVQHRRTAGWERVRAGPGTAAWLGGSDAARPTGGAYRQDACSPSSTHQRRRMHALPLRRRAGRHRRLWPAWALHLRALLRERTRDGAPDAACARVGASGGVTRRSRTQQSRDGGMTEQRRLPARETERCKTNGNHGRSHAIARRQMQPERGRAAKWSGSPPRSTSSLGCCW